MNKKTGHERIPTRSSLALDPSKHTKAENARRKKKKCC